MKLTLMVVLLSAAAMAQSSRPVQRFICNTGYTIGQCHKEVKVVRDLVGRYHGQWLGDWT
jgi:hypothetical protein